MLLARAGKTAQFPHLPESSNGLLNESSPARSRVVLRNISSRRWAAPPYAEPWSPYRSQGLRQWSSARQWSVPRYRKWRLLFLGSAICVDEPGSSRAPPYPPGRRPGSSTPETVPGALRDGRPVLQCLVRRDGQALHPGQLRPGRPDGTRTSLRWARPRARARPRDRAGHAIYRTILDRLLKLTRSLGCCLIAGLGARVILAGLMELAPQARSSPPTGQGCSRRRTRAAAYRALMNRGQPASRLEDLYDMLFFEQGAEYDDTWNFATRCSRSSSSRAVPPMLQGERAAQVGRQRRVQSPPSPASTPTRPRTTTPRSARPPRTRLAATSEAFRETQDSLGRAGGRRGRLAWQ